MKNLPFLAVFAAVLFSACGAGPKAPGSFDTAVEVRADSIFIHEILQPWKWGASGDKVVILVDSPDKVAYAYRLPDFKFLYSGIQAGGGPEDLINTNYSVVSRQADSQVLLWNPGLHGMYFTVTDTGFVAGQKLTANKDRRLETVPPADSLQLECSYSEASQAYCLFLYDLSQKGWIDSVSLAHQLYTEKIRQYNVVCNVPNTIGNSIHYAAVYPFTGRIEFYDVSAGKLALQNMVVGDDTPPEELKKKDLSNSPVYAQLASDGKYHPDRLIHAILAYQGKVYGYNKDMDFEQVYVYDLGL